jgi:hypothetical protein
MVCARVRESAYGGKLAVVAIAIGGVAVACEVVCERGGCAGED